MSTPKPRWDSPVPPFQDTESIRLQGHASATPVEECVHSWFLVSGTMWRCGHCNTKRRLEPDNYEL